MRFRSAILVPDFIVFLWLRRMMCGWVWAMNVHGIWAIFSNEQAGFTLVLTRLAISITM